jgi:hypothetical protein
MLPSPESIQRFLDGINNDSNNIGIGIVDTTTGQIYVSPASDTPGHPDLALQVLKVYDFGAAGHLRGFTIGKVSSRWTFVNNSSLNGVTNRMESSLFAEVRQTLTPALGPCT